MVFPILLTSYGSHSDHFSFQKSVPVCHACRACISLLNHVFLSHFCRAVHRGINIYDLRKAKSKVMVTKKWSEILRSTDMKPQKFPKVTKEPGTVYLT